MIQKLKIFFIVTLLIATTAITIHASDPQGGPKLPPKCPDGYVYKAGQGCTKINSADPSTISLASNLDASFAEESANTTGLTTWEFIRVLLLFVLRT